MPKSLFLFFALCLLPGLAVADKPQVLMTLGSVEITTEDVERYVAFHLPDEDPQQVLSRPGNMDNYIRAIMMMRTMAQQAQGQDLGLSEEQLAWQADYQRDTWLTGALQRH